MSETSEHAARLLRAYQAQEQRFVERRFPLQFAPEVPVLRELYSQAKAFHWNPETDIAWDRLDTSRHTIIQMAHPSPLSARNGFFGSKPFSSINEALRRAGKKPIDWQLPDV